MRFSEFFRLSKKQHELDFVDVPLETDIPLFIDPYAISMREDLFSMESNNIIVNFFQLVIDDIKSGNYDRAKYNLNQLSEPNDTRLGLSADKPLGKGVSGSQSLDLFDALKESKAAKSGLLKDLSDCELLIPGISRDKISDITTNIIKTKLIEYTEEQCKTYNIPTSRINSGRFWNPIESKWESKYTNLPVYDGTRIILIPKVFARYTITYDHKKYYNGFVLEYLQEEHLNANTGLVRLLKNGKRVVYKKDLKEEERYKLTKEFLYQFSKDHVEVLEEYIESLPKDITPLTNEQIEAIQQRPEVVNYDELKEKLSSIPTGGADATRYHNAIVGILEAIMYPNLTVPVKQERIHDGRKILDITYQNASKSGFFEYISNHIPVPFVLCECKNYSADPANPELDQLSSRFSPRRGKLGLLLCRKIVNRELTTKRCRDTCDDERGYIIVLDDDDLVQLLDYKKTNNIKAIDDFFTNKYKELVM